MNERQTACPLENRKTIFAKLRSQRRKKNNMERRSSLEKKEDVCSNARSRGATGVSQDAATLEDSKRSEPKSSASVSSSSIISSSFKRRFSSLKKVRRGSHHVVNQVSDKASDMIDHVLRFMSQRGNRHHRHRKNTTDTEAVQSHPARVRGGVRLRGCDTDEEHKSKARRIILMLRQKGGKGGLLAAGFEYRSMLPMDDNDNKTDVSDLLHLEREDEIDEDREPVNPVAFGDAGGVNTDSESPEHNLPSDRLFHIESDTIITLENRKEFIADGDMYDAVANACQEYAQSVMMEVGNLEWINVCEAGNNAEPIRAIVSKAINAEEDALVQIPTLLIATGNGKVRAGIFSRQHLICNGMECSTALPFVREAFNRKMNVVMLDPNVHGDRLGMITFEKSMAKVFQSWERDESFPSNQLPPKRRDLFVLSHSQSGAQLARYLLDKSKHYVPHVRAIVFTDSTHSIRWARVDEDLAELLESERSVYFKVAKISCRKEASHGPLHSLGKEIVTDEKWQDRFGQIKTRCAGTTEHSLTNWFARNQIWEHFDKYLKGSFVDP